MCNTMTPDELPPYLMPVVAPIYRTVNDEQNKVTGFGKLLLIVRVNQRINKPPFFRGTSTTW